MTKKTSDRPKFSPADRATLERLRDALTEWSRGFPDIYHATIEGWAVDRDPDLIEYLRIEIADGKPSTEILDSSKTSAHFWFGDDLEGVRFLRTAAQIAGRILRASNFVGKRHRLIERYIDAAEHEWALWVGDLMGSSLCPKSGPLELHRLPSTQVPGEEASHEVDPVFPILPNGRGLTRDRRAPAEMLDSLPLSEWAIPIPEFVRAIEATKAGEIERITILDTPVFFASMLAVDALLAKKVPTGESIPPGWYRVSEKGMLEKYPLLKEAPERSLRRRFSSETYNLKHGVGVEGRGWYAAPGTDYPQYATAAKTLGARSGAKPLLS